MNKVSIYCNKVTEHPFYSAICPNQELLIKVKNVALAGLVLVGLIFAAYVLYLTHNPPTSPPKPPEPPPPEAAEAGRLVRERVLKDITLVNHRFGGSGCYQPVNPKLTALVDHFWRKHFLTFVDALQGHPNDPWQQAEVVQAANTCLEVAYTISYLTLEDTLESIRERVLQSADLSQSYEGHALPIYKNLYQWIKRGMVWHPREEKLLLAAAPGNVAGAYLNLPFAQQQAWGQLWSNYYQKELVYNQLRTHKGFPAGRVQQIESRDCGPPSQSVSYGWYKAVK